MNEGYYRFPTVCHDTVVFVAEDDLWQVALSGGPANRLTAGLGTISHPRFSADGRHLAFTGKEEGDPEVYVMPSQGGEARRLTYLGSGAATVGWHPDGRIIFSTYYGNPFMAWRSLYAIDREGGEAHLLPYGRASWISFGPGAGIVLGRPTTDISHWKRYRGGTRGMLWIDREGNGTFEKFSRDDGNMVMPLWINNRIYFISDHEQHANLYSMRPDGSDTRRHTHHEDYAVRHLSSDGRHIVYCAGGDLYRYNIQEDKSEMIAVEFHSQRTQRQIKHVEAAEYWSEYNFSHDNHGLLFTARGKLYHLAPFAGPVRELGQSQGVRYRLTAPIDDQRILTISDEGGEERLEIREVGPNPLGSVVRVPIDFGIVSELVVAPNGQQAALANERQQLWTVDLTTLEAELVAETPHGPVAGFAWSPDSRWLAYALPQGLVTPLFLYNLSNKNSQQITNPILIDRRPAFDPEGKYLYFLSRRVFNPVGDAMKFDRSFPVGELPCLIPLSQETTSPFIRKPHVHEEELHLGGDESPEENQDTQIDLDGIEERVLAFPVKEGIFRKITGGSGRVFWSKTSPRAGGGDGLTSGPPAADDELVQYDLASLKEETLAEKLTSFRLSSDHKSMAVRIGSQLRVVGAGSKVNLAENKPGQDSGVVDFKRVHVKVEQLAEWYQMQREAWRWMREMFWVSDMGGVDWDAVYQRYARLLPRIGARSEFSDLIWEMQGELGSSHAYEFGGQYRSEPSHKMGFLGARFRWNTSENGYEIVELVHGDSADPNHTSPLLTPGANIAPGDILTAIDGEALGPDLPPGARLIDKAGQDVSITVSRKDAPTQTVTIRPLRNELPARYRAWVDSNRSYVHQRTNGRVGYIHIPNMGNAGFGEFHRGYLAEYDHQGLIIDVRYNGGGIVSPLLLEMLGRKRIAFVRTRHGLPRAYPYESPSGAMVALTNEHAGSDGDIFSHAFKMMNLGPLIGTRTWGGVIGIDYRYALVDWGTTTQPEDAFWFGDVGFGVENYGTDPDIVVEETPQAMAHGVDEQLERAIAEIEDILTNFAPIKPNFDQRPNRSPLPLPR